LRAALLAAAGFTGPTDVIEGRYGFAEAFSSESALHHVAQGLRADFEIRALTYKPYPCGIVIHPLIDAALELKAKGIGVDAIKRIDVQLHPSAVLLTDKPHPANGNEAQFSLQHWAAVALIHGTARITDAGPDRLAEPAVHALRDRIMAAANPNVASHSAYMTATLEDGRCMKVEIKHCKGSSQHPMSEADLETKFRGLTESCLGIEGAAAAIESCRNVHQLGDIAQLLETCRGK